MRTPSAQSGFTLVEAMIVCSIIALLASLAIPTFVKPREQARRDICRQNQRMLNHAKDMWALENDQAFSAEPSPEDLDPYIKSGTERVICPSDTTKTFSSSYELRSVDAPTQCLILPVDHQL